MISTLRDGVDGLANSRGRSTRHIVTGVAIIGGAVALSALIARMNANTPEAPEVYSDYEDPHQPEAPPPPSIFTTVWPPLFLALTLSGFRVWNAQPSAARFQALTLWTLVQAFNAGWLVLGSAHMGGKLVTGLTAMGASAAYAWRARRVDSAAAGMVAPYVGWIAFANLLTEELWRKNVKPALPALPVPAVLRRTGVRL